MSVFFLVACRKVSYNNECTGCFEMSKLDVFTKKINSTFVYVKMGVGKEASQLKKPPSAFSTEDLLFYFEDELSSCKGKLIFKTFFFFFKSEKNKKILLQKLKLLITVNF